MALSIGRMTSSLAALERGRILFTSGHFYEAHAAWEEAWRTESGLMRRLLQGLILGAAAYHKMAAQHQPRGMALLLEKALAQLGPVPDGFAGLELERFRAGLERSLDEARDWLDGAPPPSGPAPLGSVRGRGASAAWHPGA